MKKFQIESNNFQIVISNDWRWGQIPDWDEESLSQGFAATQHNIYVGTAGDDYSHSAPVTITVFNPDEYPEKIEFEDYVDKGRIHFVSGYKKMSFLPSLSRGEPKITLRLTKPNSSFHLWLEETEYPTKIIICLEDSASVIDS
jgi:hypothetical protein